jgi:HlyD family secretion protein
MTIPSNVTAAWSRHPQMVLAGLALAVVAIAGFAWLGGSEVATPVQTVEVKRGDFTDVLVVAGSIKPLRSVVLTAPSRGGMADPRIITLARNGAAVKKGDVVIEFDVAQLQQTLNERRSELKRTEAEIERVRAQARLQEEQNLTDVAKARYDVERARLAITTEGLVSKVEAEQNKLAILDAEQKLGENEETLKSGRAIASADLDAARQKRDKALADVEEVEGQIAVMRVVAPVDGMVALQDNWRASGAFGNSSREFREGDRAWPGAAIIEIPDLSTVLASARISEADRGRLRVGQEVTLRLDALPDRELTGQVGDISTLAKPDYSSWPPERNFDVTIRLSQSDPRLRGGMSASIRIVIDRVPGSLLVPVKALFDKAGRTVAFVRTRRGFERRVVDISRRGRDDAAIADGLKVGERVALEDPELAEAASGRGASK